MSVSQLPLRLLNPGPVTLSPRVREALVGPDICHRDPEYTALQQDVRARLSQIYATSAQDYATVLLTGSGTAAVEAMIGSLAPQHGKVVVAANGVYGERMAAMLQAHGKPFHLVRGEWEKPIDLDAISQLLRTEPDVTHIATVHHETTTGRLNNLAALGDLCRKFNVRLLLDAVSSFGGEQLEFDRWCIDACAATANKCLHAAPGVSFVLVRRQILEEQTSQARSLYLDLFRNYKAQEAGHPAFTPAVHVMYALQEALRELDDEGGWRERNAHYRCLSGTVRGNFQAKGYQLLLHPHDYGATLTSFRLPATTTFDALYAHMKRAGFIIYAGQQALYDSIFRIAVMGNLTLHDMLELCNVSSMVAQLGEVGS